MRIGPVVIEPHGPNGHRDLSEVLEGMDIIEVNREANYIVAAKTLDHPLVSTRSGDRPKLRELGASGQRWRNIIGGDEYNPELMGHNGYVVYDKMRRSDATVSQLLQIRKTPVLEADWWVDSADPEDETANMQAEFVHQNMFHWMSTGWLQTLTEILTMLDFGYSFFEKVFDYYEWKGERRVIWKKLATRSVTDVVEWNYDNHGGPKSARMTNFEGGVDVVIPIDDLLVFSFRKEAGNVEGRSALREVYKHWYYKENLYKIDAIQKERHGIGIPVIKLPPNFIPSDKELADELGRNLRTNEWAHIVLPPFWEVEFAEVRGQTVDVMTSIAHHDMKILDSGLASFSNTLAEGDAKTNMDMFMKSSRYIADTVREVMNLYAIPQLVSHNWMDVTEFPVLRARHIGEVTDLRTMSFTIRNLIGASAIVPDDKLEDYLRDLNDLPRRDPDTSREVLQPGESGEDPDASGEADPKAPQARLPRQGKPSPQPPRSTGGDDKSGGK